MFIAIMIQVNKATSIIISPALISTGRSENPRKASVAIIEANKSE